MKVSSILLVATCVLMVQGQGSGPTTAGPTTAGPTTYSPPATGPTVGPTNCPASLTYGGGSQKYRFVEDVNSLPPPVQILPCKGDIDNCVYTAHTKYYCMNGDKPDYTPFELNPHWNNVTFQDVSTFAGEFSTGGTSFTTFDAFQPIVSIKLFPNIFQRRLVFGGFIFKVYPTQTKVVGYTDPLNESPYEPTYIYLKVGESITEAFGRYGSLIDRITFGITTNYLNPAEPPKFASVGGYNGVSGYFDATPPPNLNGHCALTGLAGQTGGDQNQYIQALQFNWSCVGKPTYYVR